MNCPRCGHATVRNQVDLSTIHYVCPEDECGPSGMYMGEHPAKFWTLLGANALLGLLTAPLALAKWLVRALGSWFTNESGGGADE